MRSNPSISVKSQFSLKPAGPVTNRPTKVLRVQTRLLVLVHKTTKKNKERTVELAANLAYVTRHPNPHLWWKGARDSGVVANGDNFDMRAPG
jgi:hypothetical protein